MPVQALVTRQPSPERRGHDQTAEPHRGDVVRRARVARLIRAPQSPTLLVHQDAHSRSPAEGEQAPRERTVPDPPFAQRDTAEHKPSVRLPLVQRRDRRQAATDDTEQSFFEVRPAQCTWYDPLGSGTRPSDDRRLTRDGRLGSDTLVLSRRSVPGPSRRSLPARSVGHGPHECPISRSKHGGRGHRPRRCPVPGLCAS